MKPAPPSVIAVHKSTTHSFSKTPCASIGITQGLGVEGDAHAGVTVKHRSRVKRDPTQANLRQVHLIHGELYDELQGKGFKIAPGDLGENITTRGIALLDLPAGTRLHIGGGVVVEVTGLRNPCSQIEDFSPGLLAAVLDRDAAGRLIRKTGVMSVALAGGVVRASDAISVTLPQGEARMLEPV
jgi:MOSC domain-containing protein YiiM